jgi:tripartite ATP-independent transporter DctP family solute receptor
MKLRHFIQLPLVCALVAAIALPLTAHAQTKLRFAHAGPETSSQHLAALEFAKHVKERSQGKLEVQVFPGSQLGNDATAIGAVRGGSIDMMMAGGGNFIGLNSKFEVLDIPFLFRDRDHAYKAVDQQVGQELMKALEGSGLKQLAFWEVGFRSITTKNRAVRTPADVKGLKIRTQPNPVHVAAWKLLGTNPVPMPLSELYSALESGAVDAQEHPVEITHSAKFYEVQKHLTMTRHAFTAMPVVLNKAKFDALAPDLQKVLLDAAQEAKLFQRALNQKNEAAIIADLRKNGMNVIENVDVAPFKAAMGDELRKAHIAKNGPELLAAVEAIK